MTTQILSQPLGSDRPWYFTLYDRDGRLVDDYTETDPIACVIWSGLDQQVLANPAGAWIDVTSGVVEVTVAAADVANLAPGTYRMLGTIDHQGAIVPFFDGSIELTPSPGDAAALVAYCSFADLKLYAPQIEQCQDTRTDLAGFLGERARARTWTNERCLDGYRPNLGRARRYLSADGSTAGPYLRWVSAGPGGVPTPTIAELRAAIARGGLTVTAKIRQANAHAAIAIVYMNQPGQNNPYHQLGAEHQAKAMELIGCAVIEVDTSDPLDGEPDVRIGQDCTWLK